MMVLQVKRRTVPFKAAAVIFSVQLLEHAPPSGPARGFSTRRMAPRAGSHALEIGVSKLWWAMPFPG
jgi:hypothetical protein